MQMPLQIADHGARLSDAARARIEKKAAGLERYYDGITGCHLTIETPHHHQRTGLQHQVRVEIAVPGRTIVIRRQRSTDLNAAIRDAFDAARRQLEDYARQRRHQIKQHVDEPHGRVVRLFPDQGFGFIESDDGREIYFHRNSLINESFERLAVGAKVHFVEEEGERGPQASTVRARR